MDYLFDAMRSLYAAKFSSQWGDYDDGTWLAELSHLTTRHLELGVRRLRQAVRDAAKSSDTAWPPQPVAFAAMCEPRPEDMGLPTLDAAWREACAHCHAPNDCRWSHEAVRLAGQTVGWREIHSTTAQSVRARLEKRFEREYGALVNRVMAGQPLAAQGLLETDTQRNRAELAERASREAAQHRAEAAGLPDRMNADQGLAMLRAATANGRA
ncbi:replication protein P [Salinicola aestuarinus]|uniref:replication protein P n=1 Tax=Salinicola aestuarinus TaxID=1949082 RepID=UPI000DA17F69|nr:replication protein P [Salinicola aestuarinus]